MDRKLLIDIQCSDSVCMESPGHPCRHLEDGIVCGVFDERLLESPKGPYRCGRCIRHER